jgi:hypothetical protein
MGTTVWRFRNGWKTAHMVLSERAKRYKWGKEACHIHIEQPRRGGIVSPDRAGRENRDVPRALEKAGAS